MRRLIIPLLSIIFLWSCSPEKESISVQSVSLNTPTLEMTVGETATLIAKVLPSNADDASVTWGSSNQKVASVSTGIVSAIGEGICTITASAGGKSTTCQVSVQKAAVEVSSITLSKTEIELTEGESITITATIKPDDATDKTVIWTTSNATIATVNNGKIEAIKEGACIIKASTGGKSAECKVTVKKAYIAVSSITLNKTEMELIEGETETLTALIEPDEATDKTVTWSSSDVTVATVDNGIVSAISPGTVTVKADAGGKSATCVVTVLPKPLDYFAIDIINGGVIRFVNNNSKLNITLEYSIDGGLNWVKKTGNFSILASEGSSVLFRGKNSKYCEDTNKYFSFSGDYSTRYSIHGNIMSLIAGEDFDSWEALGYTLEDGAFRFLFQDNESIVSAEGLVLPNKVSPSCYYYMFKGCINLVNAPTLPATVMADSCYLGMFNGCSSLVNAPSLPATVMANSCYLGMFNGCSSLVNVPENLPATMLADRCYSNMFRECTSLVNAPFLPAITLAESCYSHMFAGCTSLETAPELPATTLALQCYYYMFYGCSSLVNAPALPAIELAIGCYSGMFWGCISLEYAPELPAKQNNAASYDTMFHGCNKLKYVKCLLENEEQTISCFQWLVGVSKSGIFIKAKRSTWSTGEWGIPEGWTVEEVD